MYNLIIFKLYSFIQPYFALNYIGSKYKLSEFIIRNIKEKVQDLSNKIFAEPFGGTGIIARKLKTQVKQLIVNDIEFYSYVLLKNYIGNYKLFEYQDKIEELNNLEGNKGFIFQNYCPNGTSGRQYFTNENGQKIDAIRKRIETWKSEKTISEDEYYFYLASLLESADKVANTASVYGAFLKKIKKTAQKTLNLTPALFEETQTKSLVFKEDANILIDKIEGDILYIDPPYNARQYGANYHLLNTIALYDNFEPQGKTGLRDYYKSSYCQKNKVKKVFEELIEKAKFSYIFVSYNNEGLMNLKDVKSILEKFGKYDLKIRKYQRFKADKTENRIHKASITQEYLHILEKNI